VPLQRFHILLHDLAPFLLGAHADQPVNLRGAETIKPVGENETPPADTVHEFEPGQTRVDRDGGEKQRQQKQRGAGEAEGRGQSQPRGIAQPAAAGERHAGLALREVQTGQSAGADHDGNETPGHQETVFQPRRLRVLAMLINVPAGKPIITKQMAT
jgi:hypothetical protein